MIKQAWLILVFLLFAFDANAAIKYVGTTGTDAGRNCSNDTSQLCRTLDKGLSTMSGGDTLEVLDGAYPEIFDSALIRFIPVGSTGAHTIIKARNARQVILNGTTSESIIMLRDGEHHLTFDGIIVDGSNNSISSGIGIGGSTTPPNNITIINGEVRNNGQQGIIASHGTNGGALIVDNVWSHHNGKNCTGVALGPGHCHGIYLNGFPNSTVKRSEFDHNEGFGIHAYSEPAQNDNVTIHDNTLHHNGIGGLAGQKNAAGMIIGSGVGILAYNNLVYANTGGGVLVQYGGINVKVLNNTVVDNGGSGQDGDLGCFFYATDSAGAQFVNNACQNNVGTAIQDTIGDLVQSGNVTSGLLFVDQANRDFRLQTGSSAINAASNLSSTFTNDFAFTTRAPSGPWDSGAYAYAAPTCPASGLVARLALDGNGTDSSGNGNNLTIGAGNSFVSGGKFGQGLQFGGTNPATIAHSSTLFLPCSFSIQFWARLPSPITTFVGLLTSNYNGQDGFLVYAGSTGYAQAGAPLGGYCTASFNCGLAVYGTNLPALIYFNVVLSYDAMLAPSGNVKLWLDGINVTTSDGTAILADWTGNITVCGTPFPGELCPPGTLIDEIYIYSGALTQKEIQTNMITPINAPPPAPSRVTLGTNLKLQGGASFRVQGAE